jgi:hypothetical protein
MSAALVIRQPSAGGSIERITPVLTDVFEAMRDALLAGRPVVVLLEDRDLLGQGDVDAAAVANGVLGLVRALAMEGARDGWVINAVTHRDGQGPVQATVAALANVGGLSGQLLRVGSAQLGKVPL